MVIKHGKIYIKLTKKINRDKKWFSFFWYDKGG
jgi:hypothetical protein